MTDKVKQRFELTTIAKKTIQIIESGKYWTDSGRLVFIDDYINDGSCPRELNRPIVYTEEYEWQDPTYDVFNKTTLQCLKDLVSEGSKPLGLNFASGNLVGGGFMTGAVAQEESLCRASSLYRDLSSDDAEEYYKLNEQAHSGLFTDVMIYSPTITCFRDDEHNLLEEPFDVSILTAAAPIFWKLTEEEKEIVPQVFDKRIRKILAIANMHGHKNIVLGAWGCGAYGNDPVLVAGIFKKILVDERYGKLFDRVVFGVYDTSADLAVIGPFLQAFELEQ
jgi:uncharacterized protein (TIGR02452 family)